MAISKRQEYQLLHLAKNENGKVIQAYFHSEDKMQHLMERIDHSEYTFYLEAEEDYNFEELCSGIL
jgi:hypothetical protein